MSGGNTKYIPSDTNMFYELVSYEALGNLILRNAFTNYVYLVRAQEQFTYFFLFFRVSASGSILAGSV